MKKYIRRKRVRKKLRLGSRARLSVFFSNRHIFAQIIDDKAGKSLTAASDKDVGGGKTIQVAEKVGQLLASKAGKVGIKKVLFDRGGYKYHGKARALAEGARKGGLEF